MEIRRYDDRLISTRGFPIYTGKTSLYWIGHGLLALWSYFAHITAFRGMYTIKTWANQKFNIKVTHLLLSGLGWWSHKPFMMTSSNRNISRVTGPLCGEFTGEFTAQRQVTRSFDVSFDLRLSKRLSKQWWGWCFETPSRSLWRHRNIEKWSIVISGASLPSSTLTPNIDITDFSRENPPSTLSKPVICRTEFLGSKYN